MKIVFDHQIFYYQRYGGISRYICELASRLTGITDINVSVVAPFHDNQHLATILPMNLKTISLPFQFRGSYRMECVGRKVLLPLLYRLNADADIIHETYYSLNTQGKARYRIVTVHDMIHELFTDDFTADELTITGAKRAAIARADHVICVSESTRQDLIQIINVDSRKISVVHHGYSSSFVGEPVLPAELTNGRPYILYVGSRRRYKNFNKLCLAFSSSRLLKENYDLVAFGGGELSETETSCLFELGINNKVHQVSGDDHLLARYYTGAALFVYPSLYEGFGIPPLEAMSFGCPVACSNTSSIPEVVGNAGAYFNPSDVDSMREAIENIIDDDSHRLQLVKLGYKRLENFSWDKCATETAAIYKHIM